MNIEDIKLLVKIIMSKRKNSDKLRFYEGPCFLFYTLRKHQEVGILWNIPKWIVIFYECCVSKCCASISFCPKLAGTFFSLQQCDLSFFNHFTLVLTSFYHILNPLSFLNWCCKLVPQDHSLQFSIYQEFQLLVRFFVENVVKHLWESYNSRGPSFKANWVAPRSTQSFIVLRSIKWVSGTPGKLMVKSKLLPGYDYAALAQLNLIHKKES